MNSKKIIYVAAMHGDEYMPVLALASQNLPQIVANPKAVSQKTRFIDMDMNKAFGTTGKTHEEKKAREVLKLIKKDDLVIDFHSTSSSTEPFAIVTDLKMVKFAQTFGLKHIVYMKHNIKSGHALIDHCNGVSVETGLHATPESFQMTLEVVANANKGKPFKTTLYEVYGIVEKKGVYHNFKLHKDGFYPVLAGEKSYDFYSLKAKKIEL